MNKLFYRLFLIALMLLPKASLGADTAVPSIASFDLFGFPLSAADQGLGKRADSLGEALAATFPKILQVQLNSYSGYCFISGSDQYKLSWRDSETEGFGFTVERLKDQNACVSPFAESMTFKSGLLNPSQFFPISHSHPKVELGVSTPDQIKKELGKPAYANRELLIYVLKRDKAKEKGCGYNTSKGEISAVDVEFRFSNGVLQSVTLANYIAGEC